MKSILYFASMVLALCTNAIALDFTAQPITGGTYRFKDCSGQVFGANYIHNYSYSNSTVNVSLDAPGALYLSGLIQATGLKPNYAYQIKLAGRNSKLSGAGTGDDATNERLGLIGRWWRAYPNPANAKDDDYLAHKSDPNYAYSGYLIIGFLITDAQGNATTRFTGDNSFHVLWRTNQRSQSVNDGPVNNFVLPSTAGNAAYDVSNPAQPLGIYGEWEPTRALPGMLAMPRGHYACDFILTEESFHDVGVNAGNWTAAMGASIEFDIGAPSLVNWSTPADINYPTPLSAAQLNATASVPGKFVYTPPLGTVMNAGTQTLSVQFTPEATGVAQPALTVKLNVHKGNPDVFWAVPSNIRANTTIGKTILDASANAAGSFIYAPPLGTFVKEGPLTLTLQFIPDDATNYETPSILKYDVTAVTGLILTSGPSAAPNPAYAGWPIQFSAASDARGIVWSWDFGDGSAAGNESVVTHSYGAAGTYTARVKAQVVHGRSETQTITVTIAPAPGNAGAIDPTADADGDGFGNALELAWGSDPNSAASTPLNGANGLSPLSMKINKLNVRLSNYPKGIETFAPGGLYRIEMKASIVVPSNFNPASMRLGLATGGKVCVVNLDENGRAKIDGASVTVRLLATSVVTKTLAIEATLNGTYVSLPVAWAGPYDSSIARDQSAMIVIGDAVYSAKAKSKIKNAHGSVTLTVLK